MSHDHIAILSHESSKLTVFSRSVATCTRAQGHDKPFMTSFELFIMRKDTINKLQMSDNLTFRIADRNVWVEITPFLFE